MDPMTWLVILGLAFGFYMAWNIGANDVANAIGTSVGAKTLTLKQAVILAAIFEFCGAFFFGGHVTATLQSGIVSPNIFSSDPMLFVYGMLAALLATGIWLQIASFFGWPVSTTHAIVGAIVGFGGAAGHWGSVHWATVGFIASSWVLSPIISGVIAYFVFSFVQRNVLFAPRPAEAARQVIPYFVFLVLVILTLAMIYNGLKHWIHAGFPTAATVSGAIALIGALGMHHFLFRKKTVEASRASIQYKHLPENVIFLSKAVKHLQRVSLASEGLFQEQASQILRSTEKLKKEAQEQLNADANSTNYSDVERLFMKLQILSACFIAFSHGANDVANAVGPLAAIFSVLRDGITASFGTTPWHILAFGGVGIVVGLATWGWRVIETIGKKITVLTPTRGFCAEFGAASTILFASRLGLPVSTTHSLVGALLGVGFARGLSALNMRTLRDIVLSWVITIPVSALLSFAIYLGLKSLFH
jgi:phosphate/sulfate permease